MIYKFVISVIVLNLLYELIEIILPSSKIKNMVQSVCLIIMLYAVCKMIAKLL